MTRCTYPDGSQKTNFFTERDEVDKTFYQGSLVSDFDHDAGFRETSRTFGNNLVTTKTYNSDNTYSSITVAGKTGLSFDYTYDANKNVLSETTGSPMAGYSWTSTYDAKDRLKTWARTNTVDSQSWDLSEVGDWKSNTVNGTTTARGHNAVHEIGNVGASNLMHDAKGNTTTDELGRVLNWDFENKLQSADASAAGGASLIDFTYDAVGRRISKDGTLYAYCGQKVCAEYDVGALAANPERKFIYGNYMDEPIMLVDADGAGSDVDEYYYHCNRQYSVAGLTDDTGAVVERYAYTPYGQTTILDANGTTTRTTSSYDNPYMYTGRRIDLEFSDDPETAMYYFRARCYSPTLGRFIGRDPQGYVDGSSLYAGYFASMWGVDPSGFTFYDVPATREKCQNAISLMLFYSRVHMLDSADYVLLMHYLRKTGKKKEISMWRIDPVSSDRKVLREDIYKKHSKDFDLMKVGENKRVSGKITRGMRSERTPMVNLYDLNADYNISVGKKKNKKGGRGRIMGCYYSVDVKIDYLATDRTDFNPGQTFGPSYAKVTDDLIIACKLGKPFDIFAKADWDYKWKRKSDPLSPLN